MRRYLHVRERLKLAPLVLLGILTWLMAAFPTAQAQVVECPLPSTWQNSEGRTLTALEVFADLQDARVVLLGESHDRLEHHRWQLQMLAGLHSRQPNLAIGLEMLPRSAQPALDAWVGGQLDLADFLRESRWQENWGYDAELYLPILHFARMNRIPIHALNLDRPLIRRIMSEGWEAVPSAERHHVTAPAAATDGYVSYLRRIFEYHPSSESPEAELERFVAGQLIWDRAMAEGIRVALEDRPYVVGLMGSGHLEFGHGVPHQLADLGITSTRWLMPWEYSDSCTAPEVGLAHAVFGIEAGDRFGIPPPLLLGVRIEPDAGGVRVLSVSIDSVAEATGLEVGDVITHAAERPLSTPTDLIAIVRLQRPGHVLPLRLQRDGLPYEKLARFPWARDAERP